MDLRNKAREVFGLTRDFYYPEIETLGNDCAAAYQGRPTWSKDCPTVNFTKTLCEETARLALLGTSIRFDEADTEGTRGAYMQKTIDAQYYNLRVWTEYAMAYGTIIVKPNGDDYDAVLPGRYFVTETRNNEIWGAIFVTTQKVGDKYYTRFEYHHFETQDKRGVDFSRWNRDPVYVVENRVFVGTKQNDAEKEIQIETSPWPDLTDRAIFDGVEKPLFAVLRTPQANNVDDECPYGIPLVSGALTELYDLDIAYYRMAKEIADSKRTVMLDADRLTVNGATTEEDMKNRISLYDRQAAAMGLPDFVRAVEGVNGEGNFYSEINPTLNTEARLVGINYLLSQIGYKIGFSNGYFVFNEQSGIQTATGVEANEQRTIQFIKDVRDRVEKALGDLIEAIAKFADVYNLAPKGPYSVTYQFGDITYNEEEDRLRWLSYANAGKIPFWYYLVKFEGMSEDDAKALTAEAGRPTLPPLYAQEE